MSIWRVISNHLILYLCSLHASLHPLHTLQIICIPPINPPQLFRCLRCHSGPLPHYLNLLLRCSTIKSISNLALPIACRAHILSSPSQQTLLGRAHAKGGFRSEFCTGFDLSSVRAGTCPLAKINMKEAVSQVLGLEVDAVEGVGVMLGWV